MAMIGIRVPEEAAEKLAGVPVPEGKRITKEEMHVTMVYLGSQVPVIASLGAAIGVHTVARKWKPFKVHAAILTSFQGSEEDGSTPIIVRIVSEELMRFREEVRKSMDKMSIPYSNKWPDYKPHVTLTYTKEKVNQPRRIDAISWDVKEIVVWAGEEMNELMYTSVCLSG
jgi:2'-5' RNA ligase